MSKREIKHIERAAFERGIIFAASSAMAGIIGLVLYSYHFSTVGIILMTTMLAYCIREANGTL